MLHGMSRNFICGSSELVCGSWPIQSHGGVWYCLERDSTQIMHLDTVLRNQTLTDTCVGKIFWQSSVLGTRYQHTWTLYMYTTAVKSTTNLWLTVSAESALLSRDKTGLQIIQVLSGSDIHRCVKTVYNTYNTIHDECNCKALCSNEVKPTFFQARIFRVANCQLHELWYIIPTIFYYSLCPCTPADKWLLKPKCRGEQDSFGKWM